MVTLTKNARGFVEGVVEYIRKEGKSPSVNEKVRKYLQRVSEYEVPENIAHVESAVPLTNTEKERVDTVIQSLIGRPLRAQYHVLPTLLGGMRLRIGELILDASLKTQLEDMTQSLV